MEDKMQNISIDNVQSLFMDAQRYANDTTLKVKGLLGTYTFCQSTLTQVGNYVRLYLDQIGLTAHFEGEKSAPFRVSDLGFRNDKTPWTHYYDPVDKLLALGIATGNLTFSQDSSVEDIPTKCYVSRVKSSNK